MSDQRFVLKKPHSRPSLSNGSNFLGQKPLPAITYEESCSISLAATTLHKAAYFEKSNIKLSKVPHGSKNSCVNEGDLMKTSHCNFKLIERPQKMANEAGMTDPCLHSSIMTKTRQRIGRKLKIPQQTRSWHPIEGSNPVIRQAKSISPPTFIIKNSKCGRQLPPIDPQSSIGEGAFRPCCPTPASLSPSP